MKQIYNFETTNPPALNESMLRAELEKRKLRRQTTMVTVAGILSQIALLLIAVLMANYSILLSAACTIYLIISVTGSAVLTILMHSRHKFINS